MTDTTCKPLGEYLAEREKNGLVDVKFYIHNGSVATPDDACLEAATIFAAIDTGAVESYTLLDRHQG